MDNSLVSVEVLRYEIKKSKSENKGIVPTEMELLLEQTQQGTSHEFSASNRPGSLLRYDRAFCPVLPILSCSGNVSGIIPKLNILIPLASRNVLKTCPPDLLYIVSPGRGVYDPMLGLEISFVGIVRFLQVLLDADVDLCPVRGFQRQILTFSSDLSLGMGFPGDLSPGNSRWGTLVGIVRFLQVLLDANVDLCPVKGFHVQPEIKLDQVTILPQRQIPAFSSDLSLGMGFPGDLSPGNSRWGMFSSEVVLCYLLLVVAEEELVHRGEPMFYNLGKVLGLVAGIQPARCPVAQIGLSFSFACKIKNNHLESLEKNYDLEEEEEVVAVLIDEVVSSGGGGAGGDGG
nr:hypothetical protein [Tanacetum cinerariifolium]